MIDNIINKSIKDVTRDSFEGYSRTIPKTVYTFLWQHLPFKPESKLFKNFYITCLLNLLNFMTLPTYKLEDGFKRVKNVNAEIQHLYEKQESNCIILYNIDYKYMNYVSLLIAELKWILAIDLSNKLKLDLVYSTNLINIILGGLDEER